MDKVQDPTESDDVGPPSQKPLETLRPSSEPPADDPHQLLDDLVLLDNYDESPENADKGVFEETDYDDGTHESTFGLILPGIDRADVADLLEKKMPHIKGSWSVKRGGQKILGFRSLKLVITHGSENTMMQVHSTRPRLPTPSTTTQLTNVSRVMQLTFPEPK